MQLDAGAATDQGQRAQNQDVHFHDVGLGLFVVADGMGGHKAGEVAARLAVDTVVSFIRLTHAGTEITWPVPFDPARSLQVNRLNAALRLANQKVYDASARNPQHAGMGTTIVAVLVNEHSVAVGHVGDSRAYLMRAGDLMQITRDHTLVNALGVEGASEGHPMRHVLTQGIGLSPGITPAFDEHVLMVGDRWLICTDGVHGCLNGDTLRDALSEVSASTAAQEAVRRAVGAGTTDNATAVVLNVVPSAHV